MNKELEQLYAQYSQVNDISKDVFFNSYKQFGDTYLTFIQEALKKKDDTQVVQGNTSVEGEPKPTLPSSQGEPMITSVPISNDLQLNQAQQEALNQSMAQPNGNSNLESALPLADTTSSVDLGGMPQDYSSVSQDFNTFLEQGIQLPSNPNNNRINFIYNPNYENQLNNKANPSVSNVEINTTSPSKPKKLVDKTNDTSNLTEIEIPQYEEKDLDGNVLAKINSDVKRAFTDAIGNTILETDNGLFPIDIYLNSKDSKGNQKSPSAIDSYENINGIMNKPLISDAPINESLKTLKGIDYISAKNFGGKDIAGNPITKEQEINLYQDYQSRGLGTLEYDENGNPQFKINQNTVGELDKLYGLDELNKDISNRNKYANQQYIESIAIGAEIEKQSREDAIDKFGADMVDKYGQLPSELMLQKKYQEQYQNLISKGYTEQQAQQDVQYTIQQERNLLTQDNNFILRNIDSGITAFGKNDEEEKQAWRDIANQYPTEFKQFFKNYTEIYGDKPFENSYLKKRLSDSLRRGEIKDELINYIRTNQYYSESYLKNKENEAQMELRNASKSKDINGVNSAMSKLADINNTRAFIRKDTNKINALEDSIKTKFKDDYTNKQANAQTESSADRGEILGLIKLYGAKLANVPTNIMGNAFQTLTSALTWNSKWSQYVNQDIEFAKNIGRLNKEALNLRQDVVFYTDKQGNKYKYTLGNLYKLDKDGNEVYDSKIDNNDFLSNLKETGRDKEWSFSSVTATATQVIAEMYLTNKLGVGLGNLASKPFSAYAIRTAKELGTESRWYNILKTTAKGIKATDNASPIGMAVYTFGNNVRRNNEMGYDGMESWFKGIFDSGMMAAANRFFPDSRFFKEGDKVQKTAYALLKSGDKKGAVQVMKNFFTDVSYYSKPIIKENSFENFQESILEPMFQGVSDVVSAGLKGDRNKWQQATKAENFYDLSPETILATTLSTGLISGVQLSRTEELPKFNSLNKLEQLILSSNTAGLVDALKFIKEDGSFTGFTAQMADNKLKEIATVQSYLNKLPKENNLSIQQTASAITNLQKLENLKKEQQSATSESVKNNLQEQINAVEETIAKTFEESKNNTIVNEQPQQTTQPEQTQETAQGQTTETNLQPEQTTVATEQSVPADVEAKKADIERRRQENPSVERGVLINFESGKTKEQLIDIVNKLKNGEINLSEIIKEFSNLPLNTRSEVKKAFNDGTLADKIQFGLDVNELSEVQSKTRSKEEVIKSRQKALSEKQKAETALKDSEYKIVKKKELITGKVTETKVKRTVEEKAKYEDFYRKIIEDTNKQIEEYDAELKALENNTTNEIAQTTQPEQTQETAQGQTTETNLQPEQTTVATEQSVPADVEAKKADIERRRQEAKLPIEINGKNIGEDLSNYDNGEQSIKGQGYKEIRDDIVEKQSKGIISNEDKNIIQQEAQDLLNSGKSLKETSEIIYHKHGIKVSAGRWQLAENRLFEINAKYDAELKALENNNNQNIQDNGKKDTRTTVQEQSSGEKMLGNEQRSQENGQNTDLGLSSMGEQNQEQRQTTKQVEEVATNITEEEQVKINLERLNAYIEAKKQREQEKQVQVSPSEKAGNVQQNEAFSVNEQPQTIEQPSETQNAPLVSESKSTNGKYTIRVEQNNGIGTAKILDNNGNEVKLTNKQKEKYVAEHFAKQSYPETVVENIDKLRSDEYSRAIVEATNNPLELAQILDTESKFLPAESLNAKENAIANVIGNKVSRSSFIQFDDANNISFSIARGYGLTNKGKTIDVIAQEAEVLIYGDWDSQNPRVTTEDVINFMKTYNNGAETFFTQPNQVYRDAEAKFEKLTGIKATKNALDVLLGKKTATKIDFAKLQEEADILSAEEKYNLRNEYNKWFNSLSLEDKNLELQKTYPYEQRTEENTNQSQNESVPNRQSESSKNVANQERNGATAEEINQVSPSTQYEGAVTYTQFGEPQKGNIYYENGVAKVKDKAGKVYNANSPLVKNLKDAEGNAIQLQKGNQRLTTITKQAFDALVTKLQKAFPRFAKVTYDFEAFKKQAEKLGVSINEIQKNIFGSKATILNANFTEFNLYQRAILLNSKGKNRDEILIETGWYLDSDNKWKKLLIPNAEFKDKNIKFDGEYKLSDILDYKSLYQYYPELKNKKIIFNNIDNNLEGYYDGENIIINKSINNEPNEELLNTIVHEIQHIIQRTDGFARGSNYNEATAIGSRLFNSSRSEIDADGELNQAERIIAKTFGENWRESLQRGDIAESKIIDAIYLFSHGEAEARLAEKILNGQIKTVKDFTNELDFYKSIGTIIKFMQTPNGTIYGAKLPDGTIYLNPEFLNANTPIHEFSHLFEQLLPSRFKKGVELLKQTNLGKKLFEQLKQEGNYANLTDEQLWGEALNTHIGNFGENEVNNPKGKLKQLQDWIKDLFAKVGDVLGIKKLSPDTQLRMFTEGVVKDLLGGKPIVAENQVSPSEQVQYSLNENDRKAKQLEIINKTNPAPNSYNTWIRTVNDIKTPEEAFRSAFEDGAMYPDFTLEDMQKVLETGKVTVYSSYPIKEGVFVSPSKMNAEEYAGGRGKKVYSKEINANDLAWIDESEGQYAPVNSSEVKFSINSTTPLSVKEQTEVINDLVANGEDSAFAKLQETNWYKGLSDNQKQNINTSNIAKTLVNAVNSTKRNLEQKVERRDAKIERNLEAVKSVKEVIQQTINDASERGLFKGITSSKVLEYAIRNINKAITPSQQKRVLNTVKKIINDNEYLNKVRQANDLAKQVKKYANSKSISKPLVNIDTAKQFAKINPRSVENIDDYIELANAIIGNLKGISVNNKLEVSNKNYGTDNKSILKYIEDTLKYNEKVKEEELKSDYDEMLRTSTLPVKDMSFEEYKDFINLSKLEENAQKFENNSKATQEERTNLLRATVNRRLRNDFETEILANKSEYSNEEQKIINRISKIDTSKLDYKQLVKLNDVINNAIYNNSFMDAGNISLIAQVQENEKAIDDFKVKNNFNFLSLYDNWATRALQGAISNDMLVEFITNSTTASAFFKIKSGISAVMDGHAVAKVIQQKTVNAFINMKKKVGWKSDTTENRNIRGIYAEMLRNNGGTDEEIQSEWDRKKGLIEQTIDGLANSRNKEDNKASELLQKVYDKTLKDANNISELEANISKLEFGKFNIDSVKFWIEQHDKYADDFIEQGNIYNNKNLEKELNYTGRKYRPITEDAKKKQDDTLFNEVYRSTEISYKESGSKTKTVKYEFLPKGLVLDLDFDKVQAKMLYDNLYDLKTAEGISLLKNFLSNPENIDRIGGTRNMEALKNMMRNTILAQKQALPFENNAFAKALDKIAGSVMMKSARLALGSVTQLPKQYLSVLVNTSVNLGTDIPLLFEAYRVSGFRNNLELFDKFNIGLRGSTIAGYNKENAIFADENAGAVDRTKAILYDVNKASKALYDGTMKALELSDVSIARTTWLAFYMRSLKKQGIDITKIDWSKEHENPNQEAAAFAEQTVSRLQNANDASSMSDNFKNTNTYAKFFKNLFMPYSTFAVNQRARMTSDMQKIIHGSIDGRAEAFKSLIATIAEQAVFNSFKTYVLANGAQYLAELFLTGILGWDDDEAEDLFKNAKKYAKQKFVTSTVSDIFFSGMGGGAQIGLQLATNKLTKLINGDEYFDPENDSESTLGGYGTSIATFLGLANDMKYLDGKGEEIVKGGGTNKVVMQPKELSKESKQLVYLTFMVDALALAGLGDQYISQINQKIKKARDKKIKDDLGSYFDTRIYIPSSSDNYKNYAKLRIDKKTSISDIKQMAKKEGAYLDEKTFTRKMKDEIFNYKVSKHRDEIEDKLLKYSEGKINRDQLRSYVKSLKDLSYDQQVRLWKTFPKENNK